MRDERSKGLETLACWDLMIQRWRTCGMYSNSAHAYETMRDTAEKVFADNHGIAMDFPFSIARGTEAAR